MLHIVPGLNFPRLRTRPGHSLCSGRVDWTNSNHSDLPSFERSQTDPRMLAGKLSPIMIFFASAEGDSTAAVMGLLVYLSILVVCYDAGPKMCGPAGQLLMSDPLLAPPRTHSVVGTAVELQHSCTGRKTENGRTQKGRVAKQNTAAVVEE